MKQTAVERKKRYSSLVEEWKKMAHEIESFASLREPAWHGLGTVFQDEVTTAEMLSTANLSNWNVRLEDLEIPSHLQSDKSYQYVVRTNPFDNNQTDVLGVVGERYVPLQNEDLFTFGDAIRIVNRVFGMLVVKK